MVTMSAYSQFGYAYPTPGQQVRVINNNNNNNNFVLTTDARLWCLVGYSNRFCENRRIHKIFYFILFFDFSPPRRVAPFEYIIIHQVLFKILKYSFFCKQIYLFKYWSRFTNSLNQIIINSTYISAEIVRQINDYNRIHIKEWLKFSRLYFIFKNV